jgi:KaiC/GvpD/RAD55 family RecA-like ATPase
MGVLFMKKKVAGKTVKKPVKGDVVSSKISSRSIKSVSKKSSGSSKGSSVRTVTHKKSLKRSSKKSSKRSVVSKGSSALKEKASSMLAVRKLSGNNSKKRIERVSSGVKNFDRLIEGGFEKNSTNLVVGGSGSGKSIFGVQFLVEGIMRGEKCLLVTLEEKKDAFYKNMFELGFDLEKYEKEGKFFFVEYTPEKVKRMLEEGGGQIETIVLSKNVNRIVIDSATSFILLFDKELEKKEAALSLFNILKGWNCTSLLISEENPSVEKNSSSVLNLEADAIILLYFQEGRVRRERFLEVLKMRGTNHSLQVYPYDIRSGGVVLGTSPTKKKILKK